MAHTDYTKQLVESNLPFDYIKAACDPHADTEHKRTWRRWAMGHFVSALVSPYSSPGFLELRLIRGRGPMAARKQVFFPLEQINQFTDPMVEELCRCAELHSEQRYDVFVGVLPRAVEQGRKQDVHEAAWVWLDIDYKNGKQEAMDTMTLFGPDMVVFSGNGIHCYKRLDAVLDLTKPSVRGKFERYNQNLQKTYGCDAVGNADRILRLPGTMNWKDKRQPLEVILGCLPDHPQTEPTVKE